MLRIIIIVIIIIPKLQVIIVIHPVSITRFPLTRFSPGSGLRNRFVHR